MTTPAKPSHQQTIAPPRGAAIAGVIFSVLMIVGLGLGRLAIPTDLTHPGTWLTEPDRRDAVRLALDLVPFAGIAFLWFMGVLRDRLGELEDKFFATVFLGSGLLFVACLFAAAALLGALIGAVAAGNIHSSDSETYYLGRRTIDALMNLFAMKMAGVFMVSTCTIGLRSAILPRWVAYTGYACAVVLLVVIANWKWIVLVFPLWMLLLSIQMLLAEFRSRHAQTTAS
ncbi:MAG: hypothetical protein ACLQBA_17000 [Candidatus Binataceae bacterium]